MLPGNSNSIVLLSVLSLWIYNVFSQPVVFYETDFENSDGNMTSNGSWEWYPVQSGPDTAHSDFLCWSTKNDGTYQPNELARLETPMIDLTAAGSARLTFWHWYEFEADNQYLSDGATIKISADGGEFEVLTPFRGYDGTLNNEFHGIADQPVFSGLDIKGWQKVMVNLDRYAGKKIIIRFEMISDASVQYAGWYIDDILVSENLANDPAVWSIEDPAPVLDFFMSPYIPMIKIYNAGSEAQTFEVVTEINISGTVVYASTQTVTGLPSDQLQAVSFAEWIPEIAAAHNLVCYINSSGDEEFANDTLRTDLDVRALAFSEMTTQIWPDTLYNSVYSWEDYNNDGYLDLYTGQQTLMRNDGSGYFSEDIKLPESSITRYFPATWGDYDNDGDPDLFMPYTNYTNEDLILRSQLLQNDNKYFTDITHQTAIDSLYIKSPTEIIDAAWFDYDNNGYLDLFLSMYEGTNFLFRNLGDGTFQESAAQAHIDIVYSSWFHILDYNNDLFPDIYMLTGTDNWETMQYRLYHNNGNGTFSDKTEEAGLNGYRPNDLIIADLNNDGFFDLHMARDSGPAGYNVTLVNNGSGIFINNATIGIKEEIIGTRGSAASDWNNDGYIDILINDAPSLLKIANNLTGNLIFEQISMERIDNKPRYMVSPIWVDFDHDGDMDLYILSDNDDGKIYSSIFRNNGTNNHWISINLQGVKSNRRGIGTRLLLICNGMKQSRYITNGTTGAEWGLGVHEIPIAHFGLGSAAVVDSLILFWPSGATDTLYNLSSDRFITIKEGQGIISDISQKSETINIPQTVELHQNYPNPFNTGTFIEYSLPFSSVTELSVYNILGQKIKTLVNNMMIAGNHRIHWDGKDESDHGVASGIYIYRLNIGSTTLRKKMLLIK